MVSSDSRSSLRMRWALAALLPLLLLLHGVEAMSLHGHVGSDYRIFYDSVRRLLADPATLYAPDARESLQGYLYPPPAALLFLPLLLGSVEQGFAIASFVIVGCGVLSCLMWLSLTREALGLRRDWLAALVIVALATSTGAMLAVRQGQVGTIILFLCVAAVWLDSRGWPKLAGALIAAGCWIKIYPVLMLFWLFCRPQWRPMLTGFVIAAVGIPLVALVKVPPALYLDYFQTQLPAMSGRAIVHIDNQSIAAIVTRLDLPLEVYSLSYQTAPLPGWLRGGVVLAMLGAMTAIMLRVRRTGAPALTVASWAPAIACLVAPLGWGHTYVLLFPLFVQLCRVSLARIEAGEGWGEAVAIGLCYLALLPPGYHRLAIAEMLPGWAAQLFYARYAVAALVLLAISWRQLGREGKAARPA